MSVVQIFGKSKCFDTKKAERFFSERNIAVQKIQIDKFGMSKGELRSVCAAVGGIDNVIDEKNEDATLIRYLAHESDKEQKLLETPKAFRTPIVRFGKEATVGYCPDVWQRWVKP